LRRRIVMLEEHLSGPKRGRCLTDVPSCNFHLLSAEKLLCVLIVNISNIINIELQFLINNYFMK
jgi:hypothetical protein